VKETSSEREKISREELELSDIIEILSEAFRSIGFNVLRNYEVVDINGIKHNIDLLVEGEVIPGIFFRIAFILQPRKVSINDLEWYIAKKLVLPNIDKFVILTLEDIDREVIPIISRYGLQILNVNEYLNTIRRTPSKILLSSLRLRAPKIPKFIVKPKIECKSFVNMIKKEFKPHIFGRRKCSRVDFTLAYIPLIKINAKFTIEEFEKGNVIVKEVPMIFDGIKGYVIMSRGEGLSIDELKGTILDMPVMAYELLSILSERGTAQVSELAAELGIDVSKIKSLIDMLTLRSFVDVYGDVVELRYKVLDEFKDPLSSIDKELLVKFNDISSKDLVRKVPFVFVRTSIHKIIDLIRALKGEVLSISLIFYPVYVVVCMKNEHEEQLIVYDGITLHENESLARVIDHPEVIDCISRTLKPLSEESCEEFDNV